MRLLLVLLALLLAAPARADLPRFEFDLPILSPGLDRPFTFGLRRAGDWDENSLMTINPRLGFGYHGLTVALDDAVIAHLPLAYFLVDPNGTTGTWLLSTGWLVTVPGLSAGDHRIVAEYEGDEGNTPAPAIWDFNILPIPVPITTPTLVPKPLAPRDGVDPIVQPTGLIVLSDIVTGEIQLRQITDLLTNDPLTGERQLDLSFLPRDTVVSYPGDANYPAFNFTHDAPEPVLTSAPAAPLALALAALAALRIRRPRLLHSPRFSGAAQCRTPTSSTCASTPPIR